jgi:hypothetical protein
MLAPKLTMMLVLQSKTVTGRAHSPLTQVDISDMPVPLEPTHLVTLVLHGAIASNVPQEVTVKEVMEIQLAKLASSALKRVHQREVLDIHSSILVFLELFSHLEEVHSVNALLVEMEISVFRVQVSKHYVLQVTFAPRITRQMWQTSTLVLKIPTEKHAQVEHSKLFLEVAMLVIALLAVLVTIAHLEVFTLKNALLEPTMTLIPTLCTLGSVLILLQENSSLNPDLRAAQALLVWMGSSALVALPTRINSPVHQERLEIAQQVGTMLAPLDTRVPRELVMLQQMASVASLVLLAPQEPCIPDNTHAQLVHTVENGDLLLSTIVPTAKLDTIAQKVLTVCTTVLLAITAHLTQSMLLNIHALRVSMVP